MTYQIAITDATGKEIDRSPQIPFNDEAQAINLLVKTLATRGTLSAIAALAEPDIDDFERAMNDAEAMLEAADEVENGRLKSVTFDQLGTRHTYSLVVFNPDAPTPVIDQIKAEATADYLDKKKN